MDNNKDNDLVQRLRTQAVTPFGPEGFALLTEAANEIERVASQSQAAQPTKLTNEQIEDAVQGIYLSDYPDGGDYDIAIARAAIAAHIAGTSQATNAQAGWVDEFGNVWPLAAYSANGKPNYHDAHKRGWQPLFRAAPIPVAPTGDAEACSIYVAYGDDAAVDLFANAMKAKMEASRAKGRGGWHDPDECPAERLQAMLIEHLSKGDPVDIGNFAMMLWNRGEPVASVAKEAEKEQQAKPELTVWEGAMPESNGKSNFTAILTRKDAKGLDAFEGFTIARSEYPDRVRYEADCVRHLIGELAEKPWITDYDANKHSGYVAPTTQQAAKAKSEQAKPIAAAVRAAERVDAMHKGVVGVFAAIKAEHLAQAHVMPPLRGTDSHHDAGVAHGDIVAAYTHWMHDSSQFPHSDDTRHPFEAFSAGVKAACRGRAQGGITSKENGSDVAPTTSTVSAPANANIELAKSGLREILAASRTPDRAQIHGLAFEALSVLDSTEGAQAAPEDVRNQALEEAAQVAQDTDVATFTHAQMLHDDGSQTRSDIAAAIRALKRASTDQANADTGSAE